MPSAVLRHRSDSGELLTAIASLGRSFDKVWQPGDPGRRGMPETDFGFNLCLLDEPALAPRECIDPAMQALALLAEELQERRHLLAGCTLDFGIFAGPETFTLTLPIPADQCALLGTWGVGLEVSFYQSR